MLMLPEPTVSGLNFKMKTAVLILAIVAAVFAAEEAAPSSPWRIVGGSVTTINQYPFAAPLLFSRTLSTYWQWCGGTIINNRAILSAAHCFWGTSSNMWRVRVGSTYGNSGGVVHNTQQLIMHPQYNNQNLNNDVAILRTASNIVFNNVVQPGNIAGPTYNLPDNTAVWAVGWGAIRQNGPSSEQLRHVQVWTVNQNVCAQRYRPALLNENMLCSGWLDVGGRDQCQGDSGGPLIHNNVVVGVCSWGRGCAQAFYPGVNARVSRYTNWITSNA